MPALVLSDRLSSSPEPMDSKKIKHKKYKKVGSMDLDIENGHSIEEQKSEKKKKREKKIESDDEPVSAEKKKKKKSKKRKNSDDEASDSGSDAIERGNKKELANGSSLKKAKVIEDDYEVEEENPNALSNFRISEPVMNKLKSKGIESLFPIQSMTFDMILDGFDMVGRARTGQGKTLAFLLPILQSLTNGPFKDSRKTGYGRTPSVLVLLPTRELAKQVHADFEFYGGALGLSACCVYGGAPMREQEHALKRGVDAIVGTPGRIKDLIERNTLDLKALKFRVLDEADEMLNMGFVDDVEFILGKVQDVTKVQTLLFSATLPEWVKKLSLRFLKNDKKTVDLVGNEKMKASASVRHLVLPCSRAARAQLIPDVIRCYSRGGRTIIFAETKESTSELAGVLPGARALHGDIVQSQREIILSRFRSGSFLVLVATNVAARGLDINDVQLIIQCEPPRDVEAYIHRSGRTGRAGNTGVSVLLYEPKYSHSISRIERDAGVKFEHISAPQAAEVAESAGSEAAESISNVSDSVVPIFSEQAELLVSSSGLPAIDLLAKAIAKAAGYTDIKTRSLLSSMEGYVTLLLQSGRSIYSPSFVFSILRRFLPEDKLSGVKGVSITSDGMGAVFDVPSEDVSLFLEGQEHADQVSMKVLDKLPPLQEKDESRGGSRGRFGGGGGFRRGAGSRFSGGGRGGGFRGRGAGGGNRFGRRN